MTFHLYEVPDLDLGGDAVRMLDLRALRGHTVRADVSLVPNRHRVKERCAQAREE